MRVLAGAHETNLDELKTIITNNGTKGNETGDYESGVCETWGDESLILILGVMRLGPMRLGIMRLGSLRLGMMRLGR